MSVLYKEKLNVEHLGVFFGTFAPCHSGHFQNIMQAKKETDACLVVVSGYDGDRGDLIDLGLMKRFRYMRELFADDENVYVAMLDENGIPNYPNGWSPWLDKLDGIIENTTIKKPSNITWYVGEAEYKEELNARKPNDMVRFLDRTTLPISATMIRENPFKYWDYITRPFRRHFSTNILVMGTASGGKTTLVKDIARSFNSPFTDEYARRYQEESNVRDEELTVSDFQYLASGQFDNNSKTITSPSNNGLFFADTNVTVTQCYSETYLSEEEHQSLMPLYQMLAGREKWDLILVIPPVTKYVNDNFRDMTHAENQFRWDMHERMLKIVDEYGWSDKVRMLDADFEKESLYDNQGFYARYVQARNIVKEHMETKFGVTLGAL